MLGALSVIQSILRSQRSIPFIEFARISERNPIQDHQGLTDLERSIVDRAEKLRKEYGIPFWTACLSILDVEQHTSGRIIEAATFHKPIEPEETFCLSRAEVLSATEEQITGKLGQYEYLAIRSRVEIAGEIAQIPMIDMRTGISTFGRSITAHVAETLLPSGHMVLQTDSSYHIYGIRPVRQNEWQRIMGMSLLFSPFVDAPWIAHQLIEGSSALRVGPKPGESRAPTVV